MAKLASTVLSVRILPRDTLARKPCGRNALEFQWNYYEKLQNTRPFGTFADLLLRWTLVWPATGSRFQLAARKSGRCAAGPRELSRRADVSCERRRRQHAGGYQIGAAGHDFSGTRKSGTQRCSIPNS